MQMLPARENPFASHRVEALPYRFPGFCFQQHVQRLEQMDWRGAIQGRHGAGKTTLLLQLYQHLKQSRPLERCVHCWFIPGEPTQQACQWKQWQRLVSPSDILLVDGLERLSLAKQLRLLGHWPRWWPGGRRQWPRSVIVTTHRPVGLRVWLHCHTTDSLVEELLLELYPCASTAMMQNARQLLRDNRGNMREVFWRLYDQVDRTAD